MKRENIDDKFKWQEADIYASREDFDADCERVKLLLRKLNSYKGKLNNEKDILNYFNLQIDLEQKLQKIIIYAFIKKSAQGADATNVELNQQAQTLAVTVSETLSFAEPEIAKLDDAELLRLASLDSFKYYRLELEFMVKNKPHVKNEEIEKVVSSAGAFTEFEETFSALSNIEMPIKDIVLENGKHLALNNSNFTKFMRSTTRDIRKQAYENLYSAYKSFNLTYSNNYISSLKYSNFLVKTYNFDSNFERINFYEEVPEEVLKVLLEEVHKALPLLEKLQQLRKKALKIDDFKEYDLLAPITEGEPKYPYHKGVEIILQSLSVMGEEYIKSVQFALDNRWIDMYPTKDKESCSYCTSCFTVHPYILTNYNNTLDAASTLSHELGHAMQSYLASKAQPFNLADCPSLTCEIASTVNEILTKKYLIDNAQNKKEKMAAINSLLEDFYGAIFKQSLYTEFELYANAQIEHGESLTFDKLNSKYKELIVKYFGSSVSKTLNCDCEWSRLPHLYSPFYVYKYVVGFVSACIICGKLLSGDLNYQKKYLEFLQAGSSLSPLELLNLAGVNILDKSTYVQAFKLYGLYIDELKELLEEN